MAAPNASHGRTPEQLQSCEQCSSSLPFLFSVNKVVLFCTTFLPKPSKPELEQPLWRENGREVVGVVMFFFLKVEDKTRFEVHLCKQIW